MRIIVTTVIAAAALCCGSGASQAWEGNAPWCAYISIGKGSVYEQCTYRSIEECRPNVISGNRGFCVPNPRWAWDQAERQKYRKRAARAH